MESVAIWSAGVAALLSVIVTLSIAYAWRTTSRRTAAEIAALRDALAAVAAQPGAREPREPVVAEFVITDIGVEHPEPADEVPTRLVLSATVGQPLVRLAALAYGVRTALTAENRNRIRFEMRREIRRARKQRRAAARVAAAEARSQAVRS